MIVLYDAGNVVYGLLFFSDSTVIVSQSDHKDFSPALVSVLNTTKKKLPVIF